ncbi:hypothetical protein CK203_093228 [Vitis vinifera]|uniref:Uncharacterized protein n=1 Tax=Vitis vinifera TaxID=29760 RepID=A0A438CMK7_VITVI|nr:hypothetical protein CK203_093228 [Vitis vinifera]
MPKEVVPGEHYIVNDLPIYEASKEADAEKRRLLLEDRDKKKNEGTLRKAPGQKRDVDSPSKKIQRKGGSCERCPSFHLKRVRTSCGAEPLKHLLAAVARLANLAEEAASVNHPDSRNPDVDAAEAVCATPMEEVGAESQSQPSDDPDLLALVPVTGPSSKKPRSVRDLKSGLLGRLQSGSKRLKLVAHLPTTLIRRGAKWRCYAELEDKLKEFHPARLISCPQPRCSKCGNGKLFFLVSGLRGMAQHHDLFSDLLRTTDYMRIFASRHKESENQLRLKLEEAEAGLSTIRKENEALRVDLAEAKSREESAADRLHEAADEITQLRGEVRQLRTEVSIEKKQREDLKMRLVATKRGARTGVCCREGGN